MEPNTAGDDERPIIVIDAANVVGCKPDGWWRDRQGATERLRDELADLAERDVAVEFFGERFRAKRPRVVLIVEGRARGIGSSPTVEVVDAPGSGDDAIVDFVAAQEHATITVVTSDRGLRDRVRALGAQVQGPRSVRDGGVQDRGAQD